MRLLAGANRVIADHPIQVMSKMLISSTALSTWNDSKP
jgi:hypothetical protein